MKWFFGILLLLLTAGLSSGPIGLCLYVLLGLLLVSRFLAREWIAGLSATAPAAS